MTFAKFSKPVDFPVGSLKTHHVSVSRQDHQLRYALMLSLALHIAAYVCLPYLKQTPLPKPTRFEVELTQLLAQAPSPPASASAPTQPEPVQEQPKPQVPKPITKPTPTTKPQHVAPVLATESPDAPAEHAAPTTLADSEPPTNQTNNTAQTSAVTTTTHASSAPANSESTQSSEHATSSEATPDEAWDGYGQQLYDLVGKNKNYPAIAIRRNWEGTVKLLAKFVAGKLVDVTIVESSQRQPLDDEAMRMLKKAVAQIPVKGALASKNFTVVVPVDFKLN